LRQPRKLARPVFLLCLNRVGFQIVLGSIFDVGILENVFWTGFILYINKRTMTDWVFQTFNRKKHNTYPFLPNFLSTLLFIMPSGEFCDVLNGLANPRAIWHAPPQWVFPRGPSKERAQYHLTDPSVSFTDPLHFCCDEGCLEHRTC
jgi:hypothetical protein